MTVASLPMYDWPELREETDRFWHLLRNEIRARGMTAPKDLDRDRDNSSVWTDPNLLLSQTCGMPWRLGLHRRTAIVGTPDYGVEECPPGYYCSVIIVRGDDAREAIPEFSGSRFAFNSLESQSGYAAMTESVDPNTFFGQKVETGAHNASIAAVSENRADIAAIDAVTWRFAQHFRPETKRLRVLMQTTPTPGLPFITAFAVDADALAEACGMAIEKLPAEPRSRLGLAGFKRIPASDYHKVGKSS